MASRNPGGDWKDVPRTSRRTNPSNQGINTSTIESPWVAEYHRPDPAPNRPGKDGGSVADPVGNCERCGQQMHHEELHDHRLVNHLGVSPNYGAHHQMHNLRRG
jgi:hypothetical protein